MHSGEPHARVARQRHDCPHGVVPRRDRMSPGVPVHRFESGTDQSQAAVGATMTLETKNAGALSDKAHETTTISDTTPDKFTRDQLMMFVVFVCNLRRGSKPALVEAEAKAVAVE